MVVDGDTVRTRRLSTREAARLMGLPDNYKLPSDYVAAYDLMGDGVAVPGGPVAGRAYSRADHGSAHRLKEEAAMGQTNAEFNGR